MQEDAVSIGWIRAGYRVAILQAGRRSAIERILSWAEASTFAAREADRIGLGGLYRGVRRTS